MKTKKKRKRKRTGISFSAALLLLALASGTAIAGGNQQTAPVAPGTERTTRLVSTRSIEGRVLTNSGAAAPGAVVLLKDGKTLQVRSYIAQNRGEYHFFGLSTDVNYTLRATDKNMTSKQKTVSVFDSHQRVKLDLKLSKKVRQPKQ